MTTIELSRPLAEKQARMKTLASLMNTLEVFVIMDKNEMYSFSNYEISAFRDAMDALSYFVELASVGT